jgi:hypothetical protein
MSPSFKLIPAIFTACLLVSSGAAQTSQPDLQDEPKPVLTQNPVPISKATLLSAPPSNPTDQIPDSPTVDQLQGLEYDGLILVHPQPQTARDSWNKALAAALKQYLTRSDSDKSSALRTFLEANPGNPWTHGLRVTLGMHCYREGRFSEALQQFETAWNTLKTSPEAKIREASVFAAAELAGLYARLGRAEELRRLLQEVKGRPVSGSATEKLRMAKAGLESMDQFPQASFKCGPYALTTLRESLELAPFNHPSIQ